jgi:hypothetical protein
MTDQRAYDRFVAALDALDTSSWEVLRYRPPAGAIAATIQFEGEESAEPADVIDISRHAIGLLLIPRHRPKRDQPCLISLTLASGQMFSLAGRVLWLDSSRSALAMGIAVGLKDPA